MKSALSMFILNYLRIIAKIQLKKTGARVIGVGGSSGKTSLSTLIALILSKKFKVKYSEGKNSETGIPLTILGLNISKYTKAEWLKLILKAPLQLFFNWERYDFLIAEMGIDSPFEPKNMTFLLKIVKPEIGVLTNISLEHSQYFDELVKEKDFLARKDKILTLTAEQENFLLKSIPRKGYTVINIDDQLIRESLKSKSNKIKVSSITRSADFYLCSADVDITRTIIHFIYENKHYHININFPLPRHYPFSILLAVAVAKATGVAVEESIEILEKNFKLPPGRMTFFEGIKETTIIDSSYNNATLPPIMDLLLLIKVIGRKRRKIAILGDMRELGSMSRQNHEEVAKRLIDSVDFAVLIGPLMLQYASPILRKKNFTFLAFKTFSEAKDEILKSIKPKDIILIKGSQNTLFLERAVELLLKNKKDKKELCRRGEFWDKQRLHTP